MENVNLIYDVNDKPRFRNVFLYALQMLLAILAATIGVPTVIGLPSEIPAAILGAGVGTLVYVLFTRRKSPIILSSSFSFVAAFPTALAFGYMGIFLGGLFAGLVYVVIALIVKFVGTKWINKLMPPVIIGPIVALVGLSLAPSAINNLTTANSSMQYGNYNLVAVFCGLVTFFVIVIVTIQNKKQGLKLFPFIIGIAAGYLVATIFTVIGNACNIDYLKVVNWNAVTNNFNPVTWQSFISVPKISLYGAINELVTGVPNTDIILAVARNNPTLFAGIEISEANLDVIKNILTAHNLMPAAISGIGIASVAIAFCPIALVSFAEHIADHKNMSRIINNDLLNGKPGLSSTLLGDGVGSIMGTALGICPNTSYGESIACVAMTKNASVITTITTAVLCVILSFLAPFNTALATIPSCVMGGVCLALYGYISVSGLRMFKDLDLDDNVNLLTVCPILIIGIGGLIIKIPYQINGDGNIAKTIEITAIATALIIGIFTYQIAVRLSKKKSGVVSEINQNIRLEDNVRAYLKQFPVDTLANALLTFGFLHENIDFTVAQLSNFMRNEEILNLRSRKELANLITTFKFEGLKNNSRKEDCIKLIKANCIRIDKQGPYPQIIKDVI